MKNVTKDCNRDEYADRVRAALAEINPPDYRAGMIPWLENADPRVYLELTDRIPNEIHRAWSARASLTEFDETLARFTRAHKHACKLYLSHLETIGADHGNSYRRGSHAVIR